MQNPKKDEALGKDEPGNNTDGAGSDQYRQKPAGKCPRDHGCMVGKNEADPDEKHERPSKASPENQPGWVPRYSADDTGELQIPDNMEEDDTCNRETASDVDCYDALIISQCRHLTCADALPIDNTVACAGRPYDRGVALARFTSLPICASVRRRRDRGVVATRSSSYS